MFQNVKAIIFDMDGTLIDSMWMWYQIDVEYLKAHNLEMPKHLQSEIEGKSFKETAQYFKKRFSISDSIEKMMADWNKMAWEKYEKEVPLKAGAKEFLEKCREQKIRLGVATSNSRELVENILSVHGLHQYFDSVKTGCDILKGKPAPDIYLAVSEELQVKPEECLVFEDIVPGIMAGKTAGMKVCAVEDEYSKDQKEQKMALADYFIDSYYAILE